MLPIRNTKCAHALAHTRGTRASATQRTQLLVPRTHTQATPTALGDTLSSRLPRPRAPSGSAPGAPWWTLES